MVYWEQVCLYRLTAAGEKAYINVAFDLRCVKVNNQTGNFVLIFFFPGADKNKAL